MSFLRPAGWRASGRGKAVRGRRDFSGCCFISSMAATRSGLVGTLASADRLSIAGRADSIATNLSTLEARSHRPHQVRRPTWTSALAEQVLALRKQYPRWGKDKLAVLLRRERHCVSISMVGRILMDLKQRGALHKTPKVALLRPARCKLRNRPWAIRKPKHWRICAARRFSGDRHQGHLPASRRAAKTHQCQRRSLALGRGGGPPARHLVAAARFLDTLLVLLR